MFLAEKRQPSSHIDVARANKKPLRITYRENQLGKNVTYTTAFLAREDVAAALTNLPKKKATLTRQAIQGADGTLHNYLVVSQKKRRLLFDMPDDPTLPQKPSELTLVVPAKAFEDKGLLPTPPDSYFHSFRNNRDFRRTIKTMQKEGYFAGRFSGATVEQNADFTQPVPCIMVSDTKRGLFKETPQPRILFSLRSDKEGATADGRLNGMMIVGFAMGHSNIDDLTWQRPVIAQAGYRELGEETAFKKHDQPEGSSFHVFPQENGSTKVTRRAIRKLHQLYRMQPLGVLRANEAEIDTFHTGILFVAEPKTNHTVFTLNKSSHEAVSTHWQTVDEFHDHVERQTYRQASWNKPTIDEAIAPYYAKPKLSLFRRKTT